MGPLIRIEYNIAWTASLSIAIKTSNSHIISSPIRIESSGPTPSLITEYLVTTSLSRADYKYRSGGGPFAFPTSYLLETN